MPLRRETIKAIRSLRREVRLAARRPDGRCGLVSEAIQNELGLVQRWGHLRLLDGTVCWLHCWNAAADGSVVDATADQFEALFPGDILVLGPGDPLAHRYLASPPGRVFDLEERAGGRLILSVDGVARGAWTQDALAWEQVAQFVLNAMSPWPQPPAVRQFVADHLRGGAPDRSFTKRDLEGLIDVWTWERRRAHRGRPWLPTDLELDAQGTLRRRRGRPVEVRPVASPQELAEAIAMALRIFPGLHQRTGRGPDYYPRRLAEEADLQVVAVVEGRVVGVALGSLSPDGAAVVVGEVAVESGYERRGVGRAMLGEVEARAAARGVCRLVLGADEDAAGFYLACGWAATLQVTIRGPQRRAIVERLLARQLAGYQVGQTWEDATEIRMWIATDGYDTALAEQVSTIESCSALVLFTKDPTSCELRPAER